MIEPSYNSDEDSADAAAQWLVRLADDEIDPSEPYPSVAARTRAFLDWLNRSPNHLECFLEMFEIHQRLRSLSEERNVEIEGWLKLDGAESIRTCTRAKSSVPIELSRAPLLRRMPSLATEFLSAALSAIVRKSEAL